MSAAFLDHPTRRRALRARTRGRTRPRPPGPTLPLLVGVVALSLLLSGFCGIISELSLFNLAETLVGGTNTSLTYTVGLMMFAMGVGSALTAARWFARVGAELLVAVELALSLLTMSSVAGIYLLAGLWPGSALAWILLASPLIGVLIGMEIPIVLRLNELLGLRLRLNASLVLAPDYFGALVAFVLFAFVLLPALGLGRAAWLGGVLNLAVAGLLIAVFAGRLARRWATLLAYALCVAWAAWLGWHLPAVMAYAEQLHYRDGIVHRAETPYQRLVLTDRELPGTPDYGRRRATTYQTLAQAGAVTLATPARASEALCPRDVRLFINGGLQFSTCDEHRYHEMLVHPALALAARRERALVLGGGDGLAVRELLKHPGVRVQLVELDAAMVALFRDDARFSALNGNSLADPRVNVQVGDAYAWLRETDARFDLIVMDFPDPYLASTARLYSTQFFRFARARLAPGGVLVTQSMSPLFHPRAFASVRKTMAAAGFSVVSLQLPMLTFEHWGFQVGSATLTAEQMAARLDAFVPAVPTRFLNGPAVQAARRWGLDGPQAYDDVPLNDQFHLPLLQLYRRALGAGGRVP